MIPFADDMREFYFDSFTSAPDALQPSEAQQEAADNLVRMLDLSPDGGDELLQPEHTLNPVLQVSIIPDIQFTIKVSSSSQNNFWSTSTSFYTKSWCELS